MAFKMKGNPMQRNFGIGKPSPAKLAGSFIDGERATYVDAEAAAAKGGNVTHTNKEAQKKADSMGEGDALKKGAYKGPGGKEQKAFDRAKSDDAKAQKSIEKRSESVKVDKGRQSRGHSTLANKEGYKGTLDRRTSDAAFDKKNSKIKTEKSKRPDGADYQGVKGASKTMNTKSAKKGEMEGTKNVKDYAREKKQAKMKELKDKTNKQTKTSGVKYKTASPMKKGETSLVDKIKSAGKAVYKNLGKVNSASDPLSDKIARSYKKNKKQYRDDADKKKLKKESGTKMKYDY